MDICVQQSLTGVLNMRIFKIGAEAGSFSRRAIKHTDNTVMSLGGVEGGYASVSLVETPYVPEGYELVIYDVSRGSPEQGCFLYACGTWMPYQPWMESGDYFMARPVSITQPWTKENVPEIPFRLYASGSAFTGTVCGAGDDRLAYINTAGDICSVTYEKLAGKHYLWAGVTGGIRKPCSVAAPVQWGEYSDDTMIHRVVSGRLPVHSVLWTICSLETIREMFRIRPGLWGRLIPTDKAFIISTLFQDEKITTRRH